jgi:septal ring factor EnvC (AmiA/AmiB activator)
MLARLHPESFSRPDPAFWPRLVNRLVPSIACGLVLLGIPAFAQADPDLIRAVEDDWARQEQRLRRAPESAESVQAALARVEKLLEQSDRTGFRTPDTAAAELAALRHINNDLASLDAA